MSRALEELLGIMARLRDPERGCPWDCRQTFASIAPYTVEEAYEVADAIERSDLVALRDELGDLLLQVVFHSRMAEEEGHFHFDDVARAIVDKLYRRHPHVFGDAEDVDLKSAWEEAKAGERAAKAAQSGKPAGILDDVPRALPALSRAHKLQQRAARVGFDWAEPEPIAGKVAEELAEVRRAALTSDREALTDELGDLLFACVNLARHWGVDAETALTRANRKFERRFRHMEQASAEAGRPLAEQALDELEKRWSAAKRDEEG